MFNQIIIKVETVSGMTNLTLNLLDPLIIMQRTNLTYIKFVLQPINIMDMILLLQCERYIYASSYRSNKKGLYFILKTISISSNFYTQNCFYDDLYWKTLNKFSILKI